MKFYVKFIFFIVIFNNEYKRKLKVYIFFHFSRRAISYQTEYKNSSLCGFAACGHACSATEAAGQLLTLLAT